MDTIPKPKSGRIRRRYTMRHSNPIIDGTLVELRGKTWAQLQERKARLEGTRGVIALVKGWEA